MNAVNVYSSILELVSCEISELVTSYLLLMKSCKFFFNFNCAVSIIEFNGNIFKCKL